MDRLCALALVAADAALVDAGRPELDAERTAVVFGTAYGCHVTDEGFYRGFLKEGVAGASPRLFAYTLPSSPVGEISIHYDIRGPATTVAPGLHAGLSAVADGIQHLLQGRAERAIVIASEVASPLLSRVLGQPTRDAAAALILERAGRGRAQIRSVEESFRPGDAHTVSRAETLGATPLIALARWLREPEGRVRIDAADPAGGAATLVAEA
jgi:3-oxoacyl-[acyl-carrier-protein] synthase II